VSDLILEEKIVNFEKQMREAFATGNSELFKDLVSKDALMICGGYRETGSEYTNIISQIRLQGYELTDIIVKEVDLNVILINYIVNVKSFDPIMNGKYRVSSLWVKNDEKWKVVFNQDSKIDY
jgi:hypothetical protein